MSDATPTLGQPGPDGIVGWTLVQTHHLVADRFRAVLEESGLSPHQFGVLVQMSIEPEISQAALARKVLITPQSMTAVLRQMEAAGLVSLGQSAGRGVPRPAIPTNHGRRVLAGAYPAIGAMNSPENLGLTAEEAQMLNRLLRRVHNHLSPGPQ